MHIAILGRQPRIGLAELERKFSAEYVVPLSAQCALVSNQEAIDHYSLGGTVKIGTLLSREPATAWPDVIHYALETIRLFLDKADKKLNIGISLYGFPHSRAALQDITKLKKSLQSEGFKLRIVNHRKLELNSAEIIHNKLLKDDKGAELLIVKGANETLFARTQSVQDINAYAARDQKRPMRDAFVGMLPPKLAQIMINLAQPAPDSVVLDPFCGTGVVLQEALLMGYGAQGTDLEPRMIAYTQENLEWLGSHHTLNHSFQLTQGDARTASWQPPIGAVVCETYLGQPFNTAPTRAAALEQRDASKELMTLFLKNLHGQLAPDTPLCLAVPAWRSKEGFIPSPVVDQMEDLGYTLTRFKCASQSDLLYYRSDQAVARQLIVATRK